MTRVDLAIDYLEVSGTLANKVTDSEVCINNIIDGLTVMMSSAHGRNHMRMNNLSSFPKTLYVDDPVCIRVYNKLLEQTAALTRYLQGEIMGAVELVCVKIYPKSFVREIVQQVEDDALSSYLSVLRLTKMITKYQSGRKLTNNERHDGEKQKRGKGMRDTANLKPDDFLHEV